MRGALCVRKKGAKYAIGAPKKVVDSTTAKLRKQRNGGGRKSPGQSGNSG